MHCVYKQLTSLQNSLLVCRYQVRQDHPMVAAMRATGAILLGKTNMHELGISPLGLNMHYGIPRNPHDPNCFAGGSSSGSAAVVAAGLCPFAIGESPPPQPHPHPSPMTTVQGEGACRMSIPGEGEKA